MVLIFHEEQLTACSVTHFPERCESWVQKVFFIHVSHPVLSGKKGERMLDAQGRQTTHIEHKAL